MSGMARGVAAVIVVAFGGYVLVTFVLFVSWWLGHDPVPGAGNEPRPEKVYSRGQLERLVRGKQDAEVRTLLGPPDFTGGPGSDAVAGWGYRYLTVNEHTMTLDLHTYLSFENGRVTEVRYKEFKP